jgi:glucose-1-phosphate thymidylyltransferase
MKGVILAGGAGTRLDPFTRVTNKHLLPVYDRPVIQYAIEQLVGAGIDEIVLVTDTAQLDAFRRVIGDASALGVKHFALVGQDRPGGIAQALGLAAPFTSGGPVAVLLGDNIFERSVAPFVKKFGKDARGAMVVLAHVDDPRHYGIAVMDGDRITSIVEKPKDGAGDLAVTGLYLYDASVFDVVKGLRPSGRGELEITDVNNHYLGRGELRWERASGYWIDCGESIAMLFRAGQLVAQRGANKPA